jgi:hypothetical protein
VHHDLWLGPGDGLAHRDGVETVDDGHIRSCRPEARRLPFVPRRGRYLVPCREKLRHELLSDDAGCSGYEYSHGGVLLGLRF